jgi:hypothetical protein
VKATEGGEAPGVAHAMNLEPLPAVFSAWEGDWRTETAYLDGWRSARDYYAMLVAKGWPENDPCLTSDCVLHRGHVGSHCDVR